LDTSASALTPLQRDILEGLAGEDSVYLSGAAALSAFYLRHRQSLDLDFFTADLPALERLARRLEAFALDRELDLEAVQTTPMFRRYRVSRGDEHTLVDLVFEPVQQLVAVADKPTADGVRYDALPDLVANKLTALLGRGDVKDLVDLYWLADSGVDVLASMADARLKDGGIEPGTLAWVMRSVALNPERLLLMRSVSAEELGAFRDRLVERLLSMAWPPEAPR